MPIEPIENIQVVLGERALPTITLFNRLEGRPRRSDFSRSLRAEVRDALWMLCRQWQMGEFQGDDAGSPVTAKVHIATTRLRRYQADGHAVRPFDDAAPLEAVVEQRPVSLGASERPLALDLRLLMGRHWLKLVAPIGDFRAAFVERYRIPPPDPLDPNDAEIAAHPEALSAYRAVAGRAMDGGALHRHLTADPGNHAYDDLGVALTPDQQTAMDDAAERFLLWFRQLLYQPDDPDDHAWVPERLEYQFNCSAPKNEQEQVLEAREYFHGRLDWYNLDVDATRTVLGEGPVEPGDSAEAGLTHTFLPVTISYDGMPNTRWWTFEDGRTNFGDIAPTTTDLNKLLLVEFGLVYANDWFLLPLTLPVGTLAEVRGLAVTNVFGERLWIEAAGRGAEQAWERWSMYTMSTPAAPEAPADRSLLLLPTVPHLLEGPPLEEVILIRDEMANMVWGIETRVPLPHGRAVPGLEAAQELHARHQQILDHQRGEGLVEPPDVEYRAAIRYQVMNTVPEHWIPFIPVHVPGSQRATLLQRAAMPRILAGAEPGDADPVRPRTSLLRHGLELGEPYYVEEAEVSRAGARLRQSFQRTRWYGGRVYTWLGIRKSTGRGEGSSGLAFDQIVAVPKAERADKEDDL
jgi:hypothetical protein